MAKRPRPSLISLVPSTGRSPAAPGGGGPPGSVEPGHLARDHGGASTVPVRMNDAGWREVVDLAGSLGIPVEALAEEAFNDALVRHHRPPLVRCSRPEPAGAAACALAVRMAFLTATWPARLSARLWCEGVAAPTLAAWAHWAALAEAGLPRRERTG